MVLVWIAAGLLGFGAAMRALHRWTESNDTFLDDQHDRGGDLRETSFPVGGHQGGMM